MKNWFKLLAMLGMVIITILAFTVPSDPYVILPSISILGFDKPLWLIIIIFFGFIYTMILYALYDKFESKK